MGLGVFHKYEGLGNDFILVEATEASGASGVSPDRAVELCDRRRGIGADGVLVVSPAPHGGARMRVVNADGSIPEMCGNGVRCVALHLARSRGLQGGDVRVETDAGPRVCSIDSVGQGARTAMVTVDMGVVRVLGDRTFSDEGRELTYAVADAGNPHAVLFSAGPSSAFVRSDVDRLGPRLARDPSFPNGTNVEFAHVHVGGIDLVVWERGVGVTLACGTGACATVAVACARGLAPRGQPVAVRLPGGRLDITIDPSGRAIMRGPAHHVFEGTLESQ